MTQKVVKAEVSFLRTELNCTNKLGRFSKRFLVTYRWLILVAKTSALTLFQNAYVKVSSLSQCDFGENGRRGDLLKEMKGLSPGV